MAAEKSHRFALTGQDPEGSKSHRDGAGDPGGGPMSTAELSAPLPAGMFHLLAADDDVTSTYQGYLTVCGEVLVASGLPAPCYFEEGPGQCPRYCLECVREAVRWSAQAGDRLSGPVNDLATQ